MQVIEVEGLRKEYRRFRRPSTVAVDGLDLSVPEGGVFGFLGPNGAGKTTTIRCLLGLIAPSAGTCRVLGSPSPTELPKVIGRVGAIVETPALFPGFSGRRNLELLGGLESIGRGRIDGVLELVGLSGRARDRLKTYSLGMRQRLGIAAALLKDPQLLVLDEPANGLDPAGIKEVRELLRRLGDEGRTVFVSSHLLAEVQHICDRVAILAGGRCVAAGRVDEVLARGGASEMIVKVEQPETAVRLLVDAGINAELVDGDIRARLPQAEAPRITRALAAHDLWVGELRPHRVDLEEVFLELTSAPGEEGR